MAKDNVKQAPRAAGLSSAPRGPQCLAYDSNLCVQELEYHYQVIVDPVLEVGI